MPKSMLIAGLVVSLLTGIAFSQTTRPDGSLAIRASQAFNASDYVVALPLLRKLELQLRDQPQRLGAIQEQIRVCERMLQQPAATQPTGLSAGRQLHSVPKPGTVLEISIKELGNFDYDDRRGGNIPEDVRKLSGSTLRLRGYMIPVDQADNITQFALVPSLFACCFGSPPQIQHTIVVNCPAGKAVSYSPDEVIIEGTLKVEEKKDDDFVISIFEVQASSVKTP